MDQNNSKTDVSMIYFSATCSKYFHRHLKLKWCKITEMLIKVFFLTYCAAGPHFCQRVGYKHIFVFKQTANFLSNLYASRKRMHSMKIIIMTASKVFSIEGYINLFCFCTQCLLHFQWLSESQFSIDLFIFIIYK